MLQEFETKKNFIKSQKRRLKRNTINSTKMHSGIRMTETDYQFQEQQHKGQFKRMQLERETAVFSLSGNKTNKDQEHSHLDATGGRNKEKNSQQSKASSTEKHNQLTEKLSVNSE